MKYLIMTILMLSVFSCNQSETTKNQSIFDMDKVKKGDVIIEVNGLQIRQGFIDLLSELNPRLKTQLNNPLTRKKILDSLVDQELLYQAAVSKNLHTEEDVLVKALLNRHVIISNALVESELDSAMKLAYEEKKTEQFTKMKVGIIAALFNPEAKSQQDKQQPTDEQKTAAQAKIKAIKARLDKGDDFAQVAKEDSDDKKTKKKGGDAGEISKNDRRFARLGYKDLTIAAFNLKNGEYSAPIELKTGMFIIKALSDTSTVSFEEAQRPLRFELQNKTKEDLIEQLRSTAKIKFLGKPVDATGKKETKPKATTTTTNSKTSKKTFVPNKTKKPNINFTLPKKTDSNKN
ncbi:hypothetical protein BVY03_03800 [bacterium K02(2017)]|nr:hypothetical protein BVY03_03800 [bacterium K02(2017)]